MKRGMGCKKGTRNKIFLSCSRTHLGISVDVKNLPFGDLTFLPDDIFVDKFD